MSVNDLDPAMIAWSKRHFQIIANGGTWTVPRSGMIFEKRDGKLKLIIKMPYDPAMPISEDEFADQQRREYEGVKAHFEAAGIAVADETT